MQHISTFSLLLLTGIVAAQSNPHRVPQPERAVQGLDMTLNKINAVHHFYPHLNGEGLTFSLKETRYDTNDIDFAGRHVPIGFSPLALTTHATSMATIVAGGGNSYYTGKGVAWAAQLTNANFFDLLPDAVTFYEKFNISVQNHSYGVGIENFYGEDAAAYDESVVQKPDLVHVFSAGNLGEASNLNSPYANVSHYATLSGSFKMAKNILTVGAVDSFGVVESRSSRGPAYDGRIKPELVAYGQEGSSGAAALVSGTVLLLQQAYREQFGELPSAAMVKAILLNSADDKGMPGPDFQYGFGNLNALRAIETVTEERVLIGTVGIGNNQQFSLTAPANVRQLKITLVWTDPPAQPDVANALIRDLDMEVIDTFTNQIWQPWVLNTFPAADSLALAAQRGVDRLNPVEQITLDVVPGNSYAIRVKGFVADDVQEFAIAYQWELNNIFRWTFPTSSDVLAAGQSAVLRWETNKTDTLAELAYSFDGVNWSVVDGAVDLAKACYNWQVPDTNASLKLRLTSALEKYETDYSVLSGQPELNIGFNCADSVLLSWTPVGENVDYTVFGMGKQYLESVLTTSDTFAVVDVQQFSTDHFTIGVQLPDGRKGLKGFTLNRNTQGVGCYLSNFQTALTDPHTARLQLSLSTLRDVQSVTFEKSLPGRTIELQTINPVSSRNLHYFDNNLHQGANTYRARINLMNGASIFTDFRTIFYQGEDGFLVFPNPVSRGDEFQIAIEEATTADFPTLLIYNALGQEVIREALFGQLNFVPTSALAPGTYVYQILRSGKKTGAGKVVITP